MSGLRFEWDQAKNLSNRRKHDGIGFEEAAQVFRDPLHVSVQDRIEGGEIRWRTTGTIANMVVVVVAHTIFDGDEAGELVEVIRIISARRATRMERKLYEGKS